MNERTAEITGIAATILFWVALIAFGAIQADYSTLLSDQRARSDWQPKWPCLECDWIHCSRTAAGGLWCRFRHRHRRPQGTAMVVALILWVGICRYWTHSRRDGKWQSLNAIAVNSGSRNDVVALWNPVACRGVPTFFPSAKKP